MVISLTPKSARRERRERLAKIRDEEILGAARAVFARQGFERASVADIAAAASVAKGTLYLYYRSKEAIYFEILARDLREMRDRVRAQVQAATTFRAKLQAYIEAKAAFCGANRDFFHIYSAQFGGTIQPPERFQKVMRELKEEQLVYLEKNIRDAIAAGEIREVPARLAAQAISDVTRSLFVNTMTDGKAASSEEVSAFLLEWFWKGLAKR